MIVSHEDLKSKIDEMEKRYDEQFRIVFEAITQLLEVDEKPKKKIGYLKENQAKYGKGHRKKWSAGSTCSACRADLSERSFNEGGHVAA